MTSLDRPRSGLVVTRTPLRISFAGGGTDLPEFLRTGDEGAVLSVAIQQYVYVSLKRHSEIFGEPVRLNYSQTEHAERVEDLQNGVARECLRFMQVQPPIYVSTVADLPAGTGLGSSSSFAVGLLSAIHTWRGDRVSAGQLAQEASHVEIDMLGHPIGYQDQYAAAFGGCNLLRFSQGGAVTVEPQRFAGTGLRDLFAHMMLFFTGITRDANLVLQDQRRNTSRMRSELRELRDAALRLQRILATGFDPKEFGEVLSAGWRIKRGLAPGIAAHQIDLAYDAAMHAGALGGKLCGAGGGGFLLFIVPPDRQEAVRRAVGGPDLTPLYEPNGTRVLIPDVG